MKKQRRDRVVCFRMTDAEHEWVAADAARASRSVTDHIRVHILDLDHTWIRWERGPTTMSVAAVPTMVVWHDGGLGQTWPAPAAAL